MNPRRGHNLQHRVGIRGDLWDKFLKGVILGDYTGEYHSGL